MKPNLEKGVGVKNYTFFTIVLANLDMVSNCLIKGTPPSSGPPLTDEGYVRGERGEGGHTTGGETRSWLTNLPT